MPSPNEPVARLRSLLIALAGAGLASTACVQALAAPAGGAPSAQAAREPMNGDADTGGWPKLSFDSVVSLDYAGMTSNTGPDRGPGFVVWDDSTLLLEFNDALSLDGLFQFKPRAPLADTNPNKDLFINRGLNRKEGGKMKELYFRYGDWRLGKFVQDFGRGYALLPGPWAADFIEEPEEGYEPSDMIGIEKIHVFDSEEEGWQQLSFAAFMVDRTFLHESFPFNEGVIHYKDGGVGNTKLPENLMVTWDVLNKPVGGWGHLTYQASVIRWGKTYGAQRGEWWTTLGGDLVVPLRKGIFDTLSGRYSQLHFMVEGARRDHFQGVGGRARNFLSASAEYMTGPWVFDVTSTRRWTTDRVMPVERDKLYSASVGYTLPSQTVISLSAAHETVGVKKGLYAGIRITQSFTLCSKCILNGEYF